MRDGPFLLIERPPVSRLRQAELGEIEMRGLVI